MRLLELYTATLAYQSAQVRAYALLVSFQDMVAAAQRCWMQEDRPTLSKGGDKRESGERGGPRERRWCL